LKEKIEELRRRRAAAESWGGAERVAQQHARGKWTARERLQALFDPDSFVELDAFVEHRCRDFGMDARRTAGDGVVTGYGLVGGRTVCAYAQDFTALGGSLGEMHAAKICRVMDMALNIGAPI